MRLRFSNHRDLPLAPIIFILSLGLMCLVASAYAQDQDAEAAQLKSCRELVPNGLYGRMKEEISDPVLRIKLQGALSKILDAKPKIYGSEAAIRMREAQFNSYLAYLTDLNDKTTGELESEGKTPETSWIFFRTPDVSQPGPPPPMPIEDHYAKRLSDFIKRLNDQKQVSGPVTHSLLRQKDLEYLQSSEYLDKSYSRVISKSLNLDQLLDVADAFGSFVYRASQADLAKRGIKSATPEVPPNLNAATEAGLNANPEVMARALADEIIHAPSIDSREFPQSFDRDDQTSVQKVAELSEILRKMGMTKEAEALSGTKAAYAQVAVAAPAAPSAENAETPDRKPTSATSIDSLIIGDGDHLSDATMNSAFAKMTGDINPDFPESQDYDLLEVIGELVKEGRFNEANQFIERIQSGRDQAAALEQMSEKALASRDVDSAVSYASRAENAMLRPSYSTSANGKGNLGITEHLEDWEKITDILMKTGSYQMAWNTLYRAIGDLDSWSQKFPNNLIKVDGVADSQYSREIEIQVGNDLENLGNPKGLRQLFAEFTTRDQRDKRRFDLVTAYNWTNNLTNPALKLAAQAAVCSLAVEAPAKTIVLESSDATDKPGPSAGVPQ